jgi:hypothetical protein
MRLDDLIVKSDGNVEKIDPEKIINSLVKSGCTRKQAEKAFDNIKGKIHDGTTTEEIHKMAHDFLDSFEHKLAIRYSLKRAIMDLGPQGFVFEKYISKILSRYDYSTEVGVVMKGCCVDHEVDVLAKKDNLVFLIECKYHNHRGTYSDVKTALYVHARFMDIEKASKKQPKEKDHYQGWLVTNTKATNDAVKYASCVKMKILAWQYPEDKNLQYFIENKKLYPISIIPSIKKSHKEKLFESGIIMVQELIALNAEEIIKLLSIDRKKTAKILDEVELLINE